MRRFNINKIHFVGIGGIGMSGIAEVLLNQGYNISGSDNKLTEVTDRLQKLGAIIHEGHKAEHVHNADVLVYSSAVREDNVEVAEARRQKIPVIKRAEMLAELMRMKYGIAIAGTHGKTTTTSMTGLVLTEGEVEPTVVIGGIVKAFVSNSRLGSSEFMVTEADEYDQSFLKLNPTIAVITNIEPDHLECYGNFENLKKAFVSFANKIPFYGSVIICLDEKHNQEILTQLERNVITYGQLPHADCRIINYTTNGLDSEFELNYKGKDLGKFVVHSPGLHNVKNATAAVAVGMEMNIPLEKIKKGLEKFSGVLRRFEVKGNKHGIKVVDDYAHHPTEVRETVKTAREYQQHNRIIAVFQPHLFSRTQNLLDEFAGAFFEADELIVTEIYPAREKPIPGVTGKLLADAVQSRGHKNVKFIADFDSIVNEISSKWEKNDMILTMGAGNIWKVANALREILNSGKKSE